MTESTKTILGVAAIVAVAGVAYYVWQKKSAALGTAAKAPASGGGTGANSSSSAAYNGAVNGAVAALGNDLASSIGHLFNGSGGATAAPATTSSDQEPFDYSIFD